MKVHEFFGALVRVLGIWEVVHGLAMTPTVISLLGQQSSFQQTAVRQAVRSTVATSGVHIIIGIVLFLSANWLVRLAYGRDLDSPTTEGGPKPLAPLPKEAITTALFVVAGLSYGLHMWLAAPTRNSPAVVPSTLHMVAIVSIGCVAVAFLLRQQRRPLYTFLITWIMFFGMSAVVNATRLRF